MATPSDDAASTMSPTEGVLLLDDGACAGSPATTSESDPYRSSQTPAHHMHGPLCSGRVSRMVSALGFASIFSMLFALTPWRRRVLPLGSDVVWASNEENVGSGPCFDQAAGGCTSPTNLYETDADWEMEYEGPVSVRKWKSHAAPVITQKWKCTVLRGRREGDWVRLTHEGGFLPLTKHNTTTMKPIPVYRKIHRGTCPDVGMFPIKDEFTCAAAAAAMKLPEIRLESIALVPLPEGCHVFAGKRSTGLYLATNPINKGNGATPTHQPICSTYDEPSHRCRPLTTTHTTTSTSTTWGWPSLFCITIAIGGQTELLKQQLARRGGVFACDEFFVFSYREAVTLGKWAGSNFTTQPLPPEMGLVLSNSSFMEFWHRVKHDGRYRSHDWTILVSPEIVFFPDRLRMPLKKHTPKGTPLFFQKCSNSNPTQLYGVFEVRSRSAMDEFFVSEQKCKGALEWTRWTEEQFLQRCLEWLQVESFNDPDIFVDRSCGYVNCWDKSKVAYHDFRDVRGYLDCWRHASQ